MTVARITGRCRRDSARRPGGVDGRLVTGETVPTRRSLRESRRPSADRSVVTKRRIWPWVVGAIGALAVVGVVVVGFFAVDAMKVRTDLLEAKTAISSIVEAARAGDDVAVNSATTQAQALVDDANNIVQAPIWAVGSALPVLGANIAAVQSATEAVGILAEQAMPPAVEILATLGTGSLTVEGGGINLAPFRAAQEQLPAIAGAFADAKVVLGDVDREQLLAPVSDALDELLAVVDQGEPALELLNQYIPQLLNVMGASGDRNYLVIFQNNAESRATGGNPSTNLLVQISDGSFTMTGMGNSEDYLLAGLSGNTYVDFSDEMLQLYESDFTQYAQNYSRTPNFPATAELFDTLMVESTGISIDGVISIDPVVLSYMLNVTGPVALSDGSEITADNAVGLVLFDAYERFGMDNTASDAYFADVTTNVFSRLIGGGWDPLAMVEQLQRAASEQRIYMWFRAEDEEALARTLGLSGELTTDNSEVTQVGIFINDASYSKLEYFMATSIAVSCDPNAGTMTTTMTITNNVPSADLNGWTLAWRNNSLGLPRTSFVLDILYFGPPATELVSTDPSSSDIDGWDRDGVDGGRYGVSRTTVVPMGDERTVSFTSTLPDAANSGSIEVRYTPTTTETPVTVSESCLAGAMG